MICTVIDGFGLLRMRLWLWTTFHGAYQSAVDRETRVWTCITEKTAEQGTFDLLKETGLI